jgi:L-threonylcarbamoyladenylate synthase
LTLVLPRSSEIPDNVTAGGPTVGVRWPSHPFIQAVIRECGFPLAAPSANLSNRISPTNAEHVLKDLRGRIPLVVDCGQSQVGIESTVLDLAGESPRVLRPGVIHAGSLNAVLAKYRLHIADGGVKNSPGTLRSPGNLPRHYSPRAKLLVLSWANDLDLKSKVENLKTQIGGIHVIAHTVIPSAENWGRVSVIPHDAEAYARALYAELHACDDAGAEIIVVETPPDALEWAAIADRLRRAAA